MKILALNFGIQKSLVKIRLQFLKEGFHINIIILCSITYQVIIWNWEWKSIWKFQFFTILMNQLIHISKP
jgi:hypothetical protein